jgi:hypothetical protein
MNLQNIAHKPTKISISGGSGTGKTTYFCKFIANSKYKWKFVYDHQGEMGQRLSQCANGVSVCYQAQQIDEAITRGGIVVFDPCEMFEGDISGGYDYFADLCFSFAKFCPMELKLFCVDEFQDISNTDIVNDYQAKVLETGRRYGLDWISVQQGLNCVHNRVRTQFTEAVIFRTIDPTPLKFVPEELQADAPSLADGEYRIKMMRTGEIHSGKIF